MVWINAGCCPLRHGGRVWSTQNIGLYSDSDLGLAYLEQGQMGVTGFAIRIRRGKQYLGEFGRIQNVQQSQKLG